ncbi:NAD-dependent malic enzyme 62 kDa isoform, mitochondrial-like [Olea europaea var. sylvestris]|uniref:NAD-dependent malic enzyme 62 kDa isoform, mitochondrial-like n=1 Tax=Olea europaea var. sylvestris TaxID=158386 RepID=UPI000C1D192E|nr:NAD-dependent malic enzyme 62 kDa isoform, mitochondrial-like [Olea europaea var. sylvestris]
MSLSSILLKRLQLPRRIIAAVNVYGTRSFTTTEGHRPTIVHKRSLDILHDPWFNKGTAFSMTERDRLDLRGLLPPNVMSSEQQIERFMADLKRLQLSARDGPSDPNNLAKWRILNRLHDRNETMYYKVLIDNIEEYAPVVYTPTVGLVCQNYSGLFRRPRGMYFSVEDRGEMMSMVYNWPADQVCSTCKGPYFCWCFMDIMFSNMSSSYNIFRVTCRITFYVIQGLLTEARDNIDPDARPFARNVKESERQGLREGAKLVEVVQQVKPDVLLGLSAVGGLFSKEVLEALKSSTSTRPAIFPMSNPTKNAECTPEEAFSIVGDNIIFGSGSPFANVDLGNGHIGHCNQANNMFLFPGIGLGTLLSGSRIVSDGMLQAAAECLASYMTEEEVLKGIIYPSISRIRDITKEVAASVIKEAIEEDLAEGYREMDGRELRKLNEEEIKNFVMNNMWIPEYPTLVYKKD